MKEKDFEKKLEDLKEKLESALDETGLREEFEEFKKKHKPKFKIYMKSHSNGEGCMIEVEGNKPSLLFALAHLTATLVKETNLTADDIREAIEEGIDAVEED